MIWRKLVIAPPASPKTARWSMPRPASVAGDLARAARSRGLQRAPRGALRGGAGRSRLSDATRHAIARRRDRCRAVFLPRNAATFVRLAAGLEEGCTHMVAVALSSAVAEKLAPLPWRRVAVAAAPNGIGLAGGARLLHGGSLMTETPSASSDAAPTPPPRIDPTPPKLPPPNGAKKPPRPPRRVRDGGARGHSWL